MILVLASVMAGGIAAFVIRWTTPRDAVHIVRNRLYAHLLEFRLFFDEPRLVWRAQLGLIADNLKLFRLLLPAMLILAVPMTWLWVRLDAMYSVRPLHPGETAVVSAHMARAIEATDRFELAGVNVDSPPVRTFSANEVTWRIRAGADPRPAVRVLRNGDPVRDAKVEVEYPPREHGVWWAVWFLTISTVSAWITARGLLKVIP